MKAIPLSSGYTAIVDDEDFNRLSAYNWFPRLKRGRVDATRNGRVNGRRTTIYMHREILGLGVGDPEVDHRNGDALDNRRANLRLATDAQQAANQRKWSKPTSSKYRGVCLTKRTSRWMAYIKAAGRLRHLGYFKDEEAAARAYDAAARAAYGEFARPNFPP